MRLPFESRYSSSPRSTRIMILSVCEIEMLDFSWCVLTQSLELQSGSWRRPSRCQGPIGSSSDGVSSASERENVSVELVQPRRGKRTHRLRTRR